MMRPVLTFALTCAAAFCLGAPAAWAVTLKPEGTITGDKITLGDIFYDLPRDEDRVIGAAPTPGRTITLNARTLLRIALATGLDWRPTSTTETITLRRDASIIEPEAITNALTEALITNGVGGEFQINLGPDAKTLYLPADLPATFAITALNLRPDHKSFEATIAAPSADQPRQVLSLKGQIQPVISVPVLTRNMEPGRIITQSDIEYRPIRDLDLGPDIIADPNALIGKTPRRMVAAGRPIKNAEIAAQTLVQRGSLVLLTLNAGALNLSTEAKALEDGAIGDVIRVVNTTSNQTLQATVTATNQVTITN